LSNLEAFLPLLEPEALSQLTSPKAYAAGTELFERGKVSDLVFDGEVLRGKVLGSQPVPHTATLKHGHGELPLIARCTCPTFTDGWEKICHHSVALGLTFRRDYLAGGEITMAHNPWVEDVVADPQSRRRYQIDYRRGRWHVHVFRGGASAVNRGRKSKSKTGQGLAPGDQMIQNYIDWETDEAEDGSHILDDVALAGMLYFARNASVSLKGVGRLRFVNEPLALRVRAEPRKGSATIDLHAFLEEPVRGRTFEVEEGRVIAGAPTWFLVLTTGELFPIPDTPPWVLAAVARQPRSSWTAGSAPIRWTPSLIS